MDDREQNAYLLQMWEDRTPSADWAPELVVERLDAFVSLVTIVTVDRALVLSSAATAPIPPVRELPFAQTVCVEVAHSNEAMAIRDIFDGDHLATELFDEARAHGLVAYCGVPLHDGNGDAIGALCVWDAKPRDWTQGDIDALARYAAVVSDQLTRKQLESELAKACRRLEQLDIVVPHEVRTPLTAIMGCLEILSDTNDDARPNTEERRWLVDVASRNGQRLLDFVERMPL